MIELKGKPASLEETLRMLLSQTFLLLKMYLDGIRLS